MITKGESITGRDLATHLFKKENDRVEVLDIRGAAIEDLKEAIDDWRDLSKGTNCSKSIYHAKLNPTRDLSREEWDKAIGIFEKEMGLEGYPRAVVLHEKKGREHIHLIYSRFNHDLEAERLTAWSDSWDYPKHEKISRKIELELGLEQTRGVFTNRDGDRPKRTLSHAEIQQGERLKYNPQEIKAEISALYQSAAKDGATFIDSLHNKGYTLVKGDSHAYVIIDEKGGVRSLSSATGVKVTELCDTLSEYPLKDLPETKEIQRERREQNHTAELANKQPLTLEQQKANNELEQRQAEELANEKRWQNYQQELYDQEERWKRGEEIEQDYGLDLGLSLNRH
jgi:Relaxase/Mobilisation nuclease domain